MPHYHLDLNIYLKYCCWRMIITPQNRYKVVHLPHLSIITTMNAAFNRLNNQSNLNISKRFTPSLKHQVSSINIQLSDPTASWIKAIIMALPCHCLFLFETGSCSQAYLYLICKTYMLTSVAIKSHYSLRMNTLSRISSFLCCVRYHAFHSAWSRQALCVTDHAASNLLPFQLPSGASTRMSLCLRDKRLWPCRLFVNSSCSRHAVSCSMIYGTTTTPTESRIKLSKRGQAYSSGCMMVLHAVKPLFQYLSTPFTAGMPLHIYSRSY